jgi:hypothetical protein
MTRADWDSHSMVWKIAEHPLIISLPSVLARAYNILHMQPMISFKLVWRKFRRHRRSFRLGYWQDEQ